LKAKAAKPSYFVRFAIFIFLKNAVVNEYIFKIAKKAKMRKVWHPE